MKLKGTVTHIFAEKKSGFKIIVIDVRDIKSIEPDKRNPDFPGSVTVLGMLKGVKEDYVVEVTGKWEKRRNGNYFPWQFKATDYVVCEFETPVLMQRFLSSLKSAGPETARRIMRIFPDPQKAIEENPTALAGIGGISSERAARIRAEFLEEKEKRSLATFLHRYGFKAETVNAISAELGNDAMKIVKSDPYCLYEKGFASFKMCDRIGNDCGITPCAMCRMKCLVRAVLKTKAGAKCHTFLPADLLTEECNAFLKENAAIESAVTKERFETVLHNLAAGGTVVYESGRYYHPDRYKNERDTAEILLRRIGHRSRYADVSEDVLNDCISAAQYEIGITLDETQRNAVITAIRNSTTVITGSPGSGKTTILNSYIKAVDMLSERLGIPKPEMALAAPTGMASKRMSHSTGREAKTIHKLFDIGYDSLDGESCCRNLSADIIIIDEVSMLDIDTVGYIMRSLSDETVLILVGDVNQIPSIGPGNVLADIIESECIPVVRLEHSYRLGGRKTILENAKRINAGNEELIRNRQDFVFYSVKDKPSDRECLRLCRAVERIFCEEYLSGGQNPYRVQVISPLKSKTAASVDELNTVLQKIANPEINGDEQIKVGRALFRKGDKVMQISNNYDKGVYNGDVGRITQVSKRKYVVQVDFQGVSVEYSVAELEQLKHAFATTVHKVQGGEYPVVIMVITGFHSMMLIRNLFYTGVTRAKERMIIVGDEDAVRYAIRNTKGTKRFSALCGLLKRKNENERIKEQP